MQLENILGSHGYRTTKARRAVFDALHDTMHPMSIQELNTECRDYDRVSIYRALKLYEQLNIIHLIYLGWKKRYELAEPFKAHHHHLQCSHCHALVTIDEIELEKIIDTICTKHAFQPQTHSFEIQGICRQCQQTDKSKSAR